MDAAELSPAVAACKAVAAACGLCVDDAAVLNDSNRLAVHLRPCDVLARVAPRSRQNGAQFEVEVACRLAETGAPLAMLDPRVEPRVYEYDNFAVTLWTYYEPVPPHAIAPKEYRLLPSAWWVRDTSEPWSHSSPTTLRQFEPVVGSPLQRRAFSSPQGRPPTMP